MESWMLMMPMLLLETAMSEGFSAAAVVLCVGCGHGQRSRFWWSLQGWTCDEVSSRRSGRYTRITATRRASKGSEQ